MSDLISAEVTEHGEMMPRSPKNSQYNLIAQALREAIERGVHRAGANLPPVRDLAEQFNCSVFTIHRAVRVLADEGVVISRQGSGIQVVRGPGGAASTRILLVVPDWSYGAHGASRHYGGQMLLGVTASAMELGYSVDVIPVSDVTEFKPLKARLDATAYCGAILADGGEQPAVGIMESMLPRFVCTHRALPTHEQPAVYDDFSAAFDRLVDQFVSRGFRRIAILAQWVGDPTYHPFLEDLQRKMAVAGLEQAAIFHRNEGLSDDAKALLWSRFFVDVGRADACFSFVPNMIQDAREWLAGQGRVLEEELFLCTHSINSFPVDGCHLVLESELLEHGRAAVKALHDWNVGGKPRDPAPIPLRFVYRDNA